MLYDWMASGTTRCDPQTKRVSGAGVGPTSSVPQERSESLDCCVAVGM